MIISERQAEIADLYFRSNTIQFGEFLLSVHEDNPTLPPSPWYMHYPKDHERGSELLPELYELIGDEFNDICHAYDKIDTKIAAVPKGALPLGTRLAKKFVDYPNNLLLFDKSKDPKTGTTFTGPRGNFNKGDELTAVDDHTSGGRNKFRFIKVAESAGLVVQTFLTVVDRQQGAKNSLEKAGVKLLSIHTTDSLLDHGVSSGYITRKQVEEVRNYRDNNQL